MKKFRLFQLSPPSEVDKLLDRDFVEFPSPRYRCVAEVFAKDADQAFELTQSDPGDWSTVAVCPLASSARRTLAGDVVVDVKDAEASRFTFEGSERVAADLPSQSFNWEEERPDETQQEESRRLEP